MTFICVHVGEHVLACLSELLSKDLHIVSLFCILCALNSYYDFLKTMRAVGGNEKSKP